MKELIPQEIIERKIEKHDTEIQAVFETIRQLMAPPKRPKRQIGFRSIQNDQKNNL